MCLCKCAYEHTHTQRLNALLIFAGQRNASYLSDLYLYRCGTGEIEDLMRDASRHGGPEPGFTQRATWDEETQELYVLSGLMRDRTSGLDVVHNSFWLCVSLLVALTNRTYTHTKPLTNFPSFRFSFPLRRWRMLYRNENTGRDYWMARQHIEPVPRYANQLVLNPTTGRTYSTKYTAARVRV